ncbi:ArsR/SmtB family transcription factor [Palleronia sp. KMU-117]|uniref:ArsR/SmtB family transcription factor n=1 Tax=Palleronia sp. KMU-117 TaxID=3434108 RepID=UPI003D72C7DD
MTEDLVISQTAMADAADEAATLMRALSNPSRLLLLCQLVEGEKSVGELERALGMSQAYVSQQLARLRGEALVAASRDGRTVRYRLADPRIIPVIGAIYEQFCPH